MSKVGIFITQSSSTNSGQIDYSKGGGTLTEISLQMSKCVTDAADFKSVAYVVWLVECNEVR